MTPLIRILYCVVFARVLSTIVFWTGRGFLAGATTFLGKFVPVTVAMSLIFVAPFVIAALIANHFLTARPSGEDCNSKMTNG